MHTLSLRVVGALSGLLLALALLSPLTVSSAQAQPPRPTLTIAPRPTLEPTVASESPDLSHDDHHERGGTAAQAGRITGTVIDQMSGAPAPGIIVRVGEATVLSDANGNYDRTGLPPGDYTIALELTADQGVAAQKPQQVQLTAGATVIVHLAFSRNTTALLPTVTSITATPASASSDSSAVPRTLPGTGEPAAEGWPSWWLAAALVTVTGGVLLRLRGRHHT